MSSKLTRPDAGSHTVEGNVSGARAMRLEQQRLADQQALEEETRKRQQQRQTAVGSIDNKFQPARIGTTQEQTFRAQTVGLVTADEFVSASKAMEEEGKDDEEDVALEPPTKKRKSKKKKKQEKKVRALLSFGDDIGDDEEEATDPQSGSQATTVVKKTISKDPTVDTSFLKDKDREAELIRKKKALEKEWKIEQERIKQSSLEIVYSYWDGSGHRRTCVVKKGDSVGEFLEKIRQDLCGEFKELSNVASDALLYVKEDLILPHDITFYDLIVTKARGKSGPLFKFNVQEDIRVGPLDRRVEKEDSHPGKVVERRWYERNKHIFPASRWEIWDPAKTYDKYTIGGGIVTKKEKH